MPKSNVIHDQAPRDGWVCALCGFRIPPKKSAKELAREVKKHRKIHAGKAPWYKKCG